MRSEYCFDNIWYILEKLKFSPPPVSKKLELGSSAKIHCKAQGTPPPIVHWQKEALNELPSHITDMNGTLHFNSVVADDKGKYVCSASNSQGVINITITVDVVGKCNFLKGSECISALFHKKM